MGNVDMSGWYDGGSDVADTKKRKTKPTQYSRQGRISKPKTAKSPGETKSVSAVPSKRIDGMVTIEEDYFDFRGQCYYAWRVEGAKDWNFKATGQTERPYIKWKTLNPVEYKDRIRRYGL